MLTRFLYFSISHPLANYLNRLTFLKFHKTEFYIKYPHFIHETINSTCWLFGSLTKAYCFYYTLKLSSHFHRYLYFNLNTPSTLGNNLRHNSMISPLLPPRTTPFVFDNNEVFLKRNMKKKKF